MWESMLSWLARLLRPRVVLRVDGNDNIQARHVGGNLTINNYAVQRSPDSNSQADANRPAGKTTPQHAHLINERERLDDLSRERLDNFMRAQFGRSYILGLQPQEVKRATGFLNKVLLKPVQNVEKRDWVELPVVEHTSMMRRQNRTVHAPHEQDEAYLASSSTSSLSRYNLGLSSRTMPIGGIRSTLPQINFLGAQGHPHYSFSRPSPIKIQAFSLDLAKSWSQNNGSSAHASPRQHK